jgi:hypothetical protein
MNNSATNGPANRRATTPGALNPTNQWNGNHNNNPLLNDAQNVQPQLDLLAFLLQQQQFNQNQFYPLNMSHFNAQPPPQLAPLQPPQLNPFQQTTLFNTNNNNNLYGGVGSNSNSMMGGFPANTSNMPQFGSNLGNASGNVGGNALMNQFFDNLKNVSSFIRC